MKVKSLEFKSLHLRGGFNLGLEELTPSKAFIPYKKSDFFQTPSCSQTFLLGEAF